MGGNMSKASVSLENNTLVANQTSLEVLNEQLTETITNKVVEKATTCSSGIAQLQKVTMKDIEAKGDVNLDVNQDQSVYITLECINSTEMRETIAIEMIKRMASELDSITDTAVLDKLNAATEAAQKNEPLSGIANANVSNTNISSKTNVSNATNSKIANRVQDKIINNITEKSVMNLISSASSTQEAGFDKVKAGGNVIVAVKQSQSTKAIMQAVQKSNIVSDILKKTYEDLGIKADVAAAVKKQSEMTGSAKSDQENKGAIGELNKLVTSIFGSLTTGLIVITVACICICCISCLSCIASLYFSTQSGVAQQVVSGVMEQPVQAGGFNRFVGGMFSWLFK